MGVVRSSDPSYSINKHSINHTTSPPLPAFFASEEANHSAQVSSDPGEQWIDSFPYQLAGGVLVTAMALGLLAAVSYQCAATWKWLRGRTHQDSQESDQGSTLSKQAAIRISHSLPDLQTEPLKKEYIQEHKETKKVLRQTTLPIVPTRHQTFQRQLSHRLDLPSIQFSICSLEHRSDSSIGLIKPELYKKDLVRQSSNDSTGEMEYCGKLHFALRYDKDVEGLVVKVLESRDLPVKDVTGSSDPYVKVYLLPDRKRKYQTKVHRKNLNPVFNETFIFSVAYEDLRQRYLQFSVYDFDRFSRHDLIGHVVLKGLLETTDLQQEIEYTMNILCAPQVTCCAKKNQQAVAYSRMQPLLHGVFPADLGTVLGNARPNLGRDRDYPGGIDASEPCTLSLIHRFIFFSVLFFCFDKIDLGELMLSLCYLPTAGRLTLTIIKGRNFKAMDIMGSSDPYVKVYLVCQGKRIKKKKTSVKRSTLSPVYNEALVFDVPADNIEDVSLIVKVIDYDRIGSNELMGCTAVGSSFIGIGRDHWLEMLDNPRKPVAQWYPLLESVPGHIPLSSSDTVPIGLSCLNGR